jgi:hypothetical protein
VHVPSFVLWLQVSHAPAQAVSQQTESTQNPLWQSLAALQMAPSGFCVPQTWLLQ